MENGTIDYAAYVDNAMRGVVRDILKQVMRTGLGGQHHFFISYRTDYPGVSMSDMLRSRYPQEITIVLQHQFWDLHVDQDFFRVSLSFNNIPEKLVIPFASLVGFADPSTKFGLQFHHDPVPVPLVKEPETVAQKLPDLADDDEDGGDKIITLDAFRKK
jgi:hypothetical protein